LRILRGTWAMVLTFFHGLPFVLFGLAVVIGSDFHAWLGWTGIIGGTGSVLAGVFMFLDLNLLPEWFFIIFAVLISLWMIALRILMWRRAGYEQIIIE